MPIYYDPSDPSDSDDYTVNYSKLLATGETVSSAVCTPTGGSCTVEVVPTVSSPNVTTRLKAVGAATTMTARLATTMSSGRVVYTTLSIPVQTQ